MAGFENESTHGGGRPARTPPSSAAHSPHQVRRATHPDVVVSLFDTVYDTAPKPISVPWQALQGELAKLRVCPGGQKDKQRRISPVEYLPGAARSSHQVRRATFFMGDFDGLTPDRMLRVLSIARGLECCMYTTWSHPERHEADGSWSFRLAFPLSRPVAVHEWSGFWARMQVLFEGMLDQQCSDIARMYILPCSPRGDRHLLSHQEGNPLPVDGIMSMPEPPREVAGAGTRQITRGDLSQLASSLARSQQDGAKDVVGILRAIIKGSSFAEPGHRDMAMYMAASRIATRWPDADAASVAGLALPSLAVMAREASDCPGPEVFEDKVRRACARLAEEQARLQAARQAALVHDIKAALGDSRSEPYSKEELTGFAADMGCTVDDLRSRWIVQLENRYYIYKNGSYMPTVCESMLPPAAAKDLAPASSAGVGTWVVDKEGKARHKRRTELMEDYGIAVRHLRIDLCADKTRLDLTHDTMVEAPCPLRKLEPRYDSDVARWLEALGGRQHEKLLDWVAAVTLLDQPAAILYLDGPKDVGKGLLSRGLSRLWTEGGPTDMARLCGGWNDALLRCPLILADEELPERNLKKASTAWLRSLVQERDRTLSRKYAHHDTVVHGCMRLMMAANNRHLLDAYENLTGEDIDAVVDRFLYIHTDSSAAAVLESVGPQGRYAMVEGDAIARHALWLRDNRSVDRSKRFLAAGVDSAFHRGLAIGQGLPSAVCNWCCAYLLDPMRMDATRQGGVRVEGGKLLVTSKALLECWDMYTTHERPPSLRRLGMAVVSLSKGDRHYRRAGGRGMQYREIDGDKLLQWALDTGYCTEEDLILGLARYTEEV
jgi:hypothetical protein